MSWRGSPPRLALAVAIAVLVGVISTVAGGEFRIGWEYLLIDIPGAGLAICAGCLLSRGVGGHSRQSVRVPERK